MEKGGIEMKISKAKSKKRFFTEDRRRQIKKVTTFSILFFFFLLEISLGFQYPEFLHGKTIIEESSVTTPYGILDSSFIQSRDKYYVLWKLREGSENCTLLLSLSGKWSMRVGENVAVLPVSMEDLINLRNTEKKRFGCLKILLSAADKALENSPDQWIPYDLLYSLLNGETHPIVKEKVSFHAGISQISEDDECQDLYEDCLRKVDNFLADCYRLCENEEERAKCRRECRKGYINMRMECLKAYLDCRGRK